MSKPLAISLLIVTLIIGIGIGYVITPEYAKLANHNDLGKADSQYDARFIDAMIEHHEGAIQMANDAKMKSDRPEILQLADEIIKAQTSEIQMMKEWKADWYPSNK